MDNNTNNDNNQKNDTAATSPLTSLTSSLLPHLPQQPTTTEETYATHRKQQLSLKSLKECQQTRRAKFLQEQKERREMTVMKARKLLSFVEKGGMKNKDDSDEEDSESEDEPETTTQLKRARSASVSSSSEDEQDNNNNDIPKSNKDAFTGYRTTKKRKETHIIDKPKKTPFKNYLTNPEHLEAPYPPDLHQNWFYIPLPTASLPNTSLTRALLLSHNGTTSLLSPYTGNIITTLPTPFPGGKPSRSYKPTDHVILDTLIEYESLVSRVRRIHVLDVIEWGGMELVGCEVEFRLFWRDGKIAELEVGGKGMPEIVGVPYFVLPDEKILSEGSEKNIDIWSGKNDGGIVLFYHKQGHYVLGTEGLNPLCCWVEGKKVGL